MKESSYAGSSVIPRNQAHGFHHQKQTGNIAVATAHSVRSRVPPQQEMIPQEEELYEKQEVGGTSNLDNQNHPDELWSSSARHGVVGHELPTPAVDNSGPNSCNHDKSTVAETDPSIVPKATPSPPKTAFMCFSISRTKGADSTKTLDFDALADEYKRLPLPEKKKWEAEAQKDKQRYSEEKNGHQGPWQLPVRRAKKHPLAPKRPMSAFLRYSKCLRNKVKAENPHVDNTDISRLLGHMWRNASNEEKEPFVQQELKERAIYKVEMAKWRMMQKKMEIEMALNNGPFVSYQHEVLESPDANDNRYLPEDFRTIDFHTPQQHNKPCLQGSTSGEETTNSYNQTYPGYHPAPYYDGGYGYQEASSSTDHNYYYDAKYRYDHYYRRYDDASPRFESCGSAAVVESTSEGCNDYYIQGDFYRRHSCTNDNFENSRSAADLHRYDDYAKQMSSYHYPTHDDFHECNDHDERFHPKRRGYSRYWDRGARGGTTEFQEPSSHSTF